MSRLQAQRGQTLPMVAVALLVLMGAAGLAVDVGYHQFRQRIQQSATDSAALAAGQELKAGNYQKAAWADAQSNGFTDGSVSGTCTPSTTVTCVFVNNPPDANDPYAGNSDAVQVIITSPNPTFFQKVFGFTNVTISTKAVAVLVDEPSNLCFAALNGATNFNAGQNGGTVNAPNCGMAFNGGANFNNATVTAAELDCTGTCSNGTFTSATPKPAAPVSDPCPAITYCAYLSNNPPTCTSQTSVPKDVAGNVTLQPGCYGSTGAKLKNMSNVTLTCGLYVLQGTFDIETTGQNGTPINVTQSCSAPGGVTLFVDTGGQITMKNVNVSLSAPTTGDYNQYTAGEQNVLFYQKPGNSNTVLLQSASCPSCASNLNGMIYAPAANMNYNASNNTTSGTGVLIIVGQANFNGSLSNIFGAPGSGNNTIKTAILGE